MLRYKDSNNQIFEGSTPQDIVRAMRNAAWTDTNKGVYMDEVAWRINQFNGPALICADTSEMFVRSLVESGLLISIGE